MDEVWQLTIKKTNYKKSLLKLAGFSLFEG
jgi:hypothetical protein